MDYERRQIYRGPEEFVDLPASDKDAEDEIDDALADHPDNGDVMSAVVLEANPKKILAIRQNGERLEINGEGLRPAQSGLSEKAAPKIKIRRGAVIRVARTPKSAWEITQLPEVEGAFVALDPRDGAIHALVGGFDFNKNKFNHVMQAWRQPGSAFKPFIYSAALEKGFTPSTVVNDAPLFFDAGVTGGQPWEPKNYDGKFEGPMPLHTALAKSKNMVSIRILQAVGTQNAQDWISRFGFDAEKHPPYLTMALGAGAVTPMQMATAYSVFANGGYRINPWLITKITDQRGKVLVESQPPLPNESVRAVDARNAFIMSRLLQEVARVGTAARAQATLKRVDLYGKTGTTNDSIDTWFAGFQPTLTAVAWMGYDTPRSLGDARDRRRPEPAGLDHLHGNGAQGRAGDGAVRTRGRGQRRGRVVLRGIRARWRRGQPGRRDSRPGQRICITRPEPAAGARGQEPDEFGRPAAQPSARVAVGGTQEHPGSVPELGWPGPLGEIQRLAGLLTRVAGEIREELAIALGVQPQAPVELVVEPAGAGGHPDLVQGLLQVHDDLAAVGESERDHPADPLVVDVRVGLVIDPVAAGFDATQQRFGSIHEFGVGHYNFTMLNVFQILVSTTRLRLVLAVCVVGAMAGCGQRGPLFLPTGDAAASRATFPQTLTRPTPPASAPATGTGTANPVPRP